VDSFDNGETWNGTGGIVSSTAATNVLSFAVGYAENSEIGSGSYATFGGQAVGSHSVLIKYTRNGDCNLDGVVNGDDGGILGGAFGLGGSTYGNWHFGDMDYDGSVDGDDGGSLNGAYDPNATPV